MTKLTLKPCPMCDANDVSVKKLGKKFYVQCNLSTPKAWLHKDEHCEVRNVVSGIFDTPEKAAEEWNWRLDAN